MPGSKRRQLKKLLSPSSSSSSSTPNSNTISPIPSNEVGPGSGLGSGLPPPSSSPSKSSTSLSSLLHLKPKHSNSNSNPNPNSNTIGGGVPIEPIKSGESISSNPNNYLTDEQLETDLVLEEMAEREKTIGTGTGMGEKMISSSPSNGVDIRMTSPSPPPPASHTHNRDNGSSSIPLPKENVAGGIAGGMYGKAFGVGGSGKVADGVDGTGSGGGKKKSSRQKFEERQARKKAALLESAPPVDPGWTAQLEQERQQEIRVISGACEVLGREIYEIAPDGHCMFNAIADQLYQIGLLPAEQATNTSLIRRTASKYIFDHKDDFIAFLPSINGEDSAGATEHDGIMTEQEFGKYCHLIAESGEWGGEPEIQALSRAFNVPIHVVQSGPPTIVSHGGSDDTFGGGLTPEQSAKSGDKVVRISYHRRMYGLGEFKKGSIDVDDG